MRIVTTDPSAIAANSQDLRIDQRFTAATVRSNSRFSYTLGTDVCDILVGVIPFGSTSVQPMTLTVPMRRLLNGVQPDCIRTIRFNHLLNILTSWAHEVKGVDLNANSVVFLGFGTQLPTG